MSCASLATKCASPRRRIASEAARMDSQRIGVATKCTFCKDRIDLAERTGRVPGRDPEVTPACVNSCISGAMHFGDILDGDSNISRLLAENESFRMHEELGTAPAVHYILDRR